jgi:outer membrane protein TolC
MQQRAAARHALAVLCGQAPEEFTLGNTETLAAITQPAIRPAMPAELLALRPDIQAAEARLRSANFDIGMARAAFFPSLSLSASGGIDAASTAKLFPPAALGNLGAVCWRRCFRVGPCLAGSRWIARASSNWSPPIARRC